MKKYLLLTFIIILFVQCTSGQENKCSNKNHNKSIDLYTKGFIEFMNKNYDKAILYFQESILFDPDCDGIFQQYRELIYCYKAINDNYNAQKYLEIAIPKTKSLSVKSDFLSLQASFQYYQKNYIECIKKCTEAISNDKSNMNAYFFRGGAKYYLKDNNGALNDYSIIINEYEANFYKDQNINEIGQRMQDVERIKFKNIIGGTYYSRGIILYELNYKLDACNDWSKAGEVGHSDAYILIQNYCN